MGGGGGGGGGVEQYSGIVVLWHIVAVAVALQHCCTAAFVVIRLPRAL